MNPTLDVGSFFVKNLNLYFKKENKIFIDFVLCHFFTSLVHKVLAAVVEEPIRIAARLKLYFHHTMIKADAAKLPSILHFKHTYVHT